MTNEVIPFKIKMSKYLLQKITKEKLTQLVNLFSIFIFVYQMFMCTNMAGKLSDTLLVVNSKLRFFTCSNQKVNLCSTFMVMCVGKKVIISFTLAFLNAELICIG